MAKRGQRASVKKASTRSRADRQPQGPQASVDAPTPPSPRRPPSPAASFMRTLLIAACAPIAVFAFHLLRTADLVGKDYRIGHWAMGGQTKVDDGGGVKIDIGPQPVSMIHLISDRSPAYTVLTLDIALPGPPAPRVSLLYGKDAHKGRLYQYDLSRWIRRVGVNRIEIPVESIPAFDGSTGVGLSFASPGGASQIAVANAKLSSVSYVRRLPAMLSGLFRRVPLSQGANNFIAIQTVAGRGFLQLFWIGLALSALALAARRFLLHEPIPLLAHVAVTILTLTVAIDLRNSADYAMNARSALTLRRESKDFYDHLGKHERFFPWFGDTIQAIREGLPEGGQYSLNIANSGGGHSEAIARMVYYARPALPAKRPEASLAVVYGAAATDFDNSEEWKKETTFPSGVVAYRRRP